MSCLYYVLELLYRYLFENDFFIVFFVRVSSAELTRLWNICPDNMAACRSEKRYLIHPCSSCWVRIPRLYQISIFSRNFLPDLKEFFEEAIDQADPESQIEEQYK